MTLASRITPVSSSVATATSRSRLASLLEEARERTLLLIQPVTEADLLAQHDPLMGPIIWDLGHIAHFEALWLLRNLEGRIEFVEMPGLYNPFEHPRRERGELPLPGLAETLRTMSEIREQVLERLEHVDLQSDDPLLHGGYVYQMVLQHEYQHNETMLQTLQLKRGAPYTPALRSHLLCSGDASFAGTMVRVDVDTAWIGTDDRSCAYDNERPRHRVEPRTFWIDRAPVTNGEFLAFMRDGGYDHRELWSDAGWSWRSESGAEAPKYWRRDGGEWLARTMDREGAPDPMDPVIHVCYHEAAAFAQWAGKRLPTESEWEIAASWDPERQTQVAYPWGDAPATNATANVDQLAFGVTPVGTYGANVSPLGCYGMIGDVWEWTSTDFAAYPGFEAFPYAEYSQVFFGNEYKVLRGGSWATRPGAIRNTFRNWDYPIRRQIFSGFRCARDD